MAIAGFSPVTFALIEDIVGEISSGISEIRYERPNLIVVTTDGTELSTEINLQQWYNVTQAEFDLLTPNPTIKDNYYVIDNKQIVYCDGTQFIPISTTIESLTVDEQDVIIKKCVGDYYISTATKLTQNDLMNITSKNNYLSTSDLNTFMQMLK